MQALNQTSYLLLAAVVVAITLVGVLGLTNWPARRAIVGGVVAVLLAAFLVLRSGGSQATSLNPNPPKDTDGRREESGRGVRELQGK